MSLESLAAIRDGKCVERLEGQAENDRVGVLPEGPVKSLIQELPGLGCAKIAAPRLLPLSARAICLFLVVSSSRCCCYHCRRFRAGPGFLRPALGCRLGRGSGGILGTRPSDSRV